MANIYIENLKNIKINKNLPKSVMKYLERFKNKDRYETSLKAYSLLFNLLETEYKQDIKNLDFVLNEYNKPYFKDKRDLFFNISHSKNLVAIVISDKECGIDIEYISQNINPNIRNKFFSDSELKKYDSITSKEEKLKFLFKIWTTKEAYYKCIGIGLDYAIIKNEKDYSSVRSFMYDDDNKKYYVSIKA